MGNLSLASNINSNPALGAPNDLYVINANIALSYDLQATLEQCAEAARTILGECIFDISIGIPYQEVVWVGVPNINQFSSSLRTAFLAVNGVVEVVSLIVGQTQSNSSLISQSADMLTYSAIIRTTYGTGTING